MKINSELVKYFKNNYADDFQGTIKNNWPHWDP